MENDVTFAAEVEARSGQNIRLCYHCMKCLAGCTMGNHMDKGPNGVLRLTQYGERTQVLRHKDIWYCVTCKKCGVRCPNDVDMSKVFDALREMSAEAGLAYKSERKVPIIHEEFVRNIRIFGRLHEATFFMGYVMRSFDFLSNLPSGLMLMKRFKLPILPKWIKGIRELRRVMASTYRPRDKKKGKD